MLSQTPLPLEVYENAHAFSYVWKNHSASCGEQECCKIPYCETFKCLKVVDALFEKVNGYLESLTPDQIEKGG